MWRVIHLDKSISRDELKRQADWVKANITREPRWWGATDWAAFKVPTRKIKSLSTGRVEDDD